MKNTRTAAQAWYQRWQVWLAIWLATLPVNVFIQVATHGLLNSGTDDNSSLRAVVNILSVLLGFYFFIGWLPVIIAYTKRRK